MAQRTPKRTPKPARSDELEQVFGALETALPGVEILDRGLEFDEGGRADFGGVDDAGRLVLGLFAGEDADRSALDALDALSFARRNAELLAQHLRSTRVVPSLDPRVLLIVEPADRALVRRVAPLVGRGLEVFELRAVKSRAGERAYLLAIGGAADTGLPDEPGSVDDFLAALPESLGELGRLVVDRMARLDDELRIEATADTVAWFFQHQLLLRLEHRGDELRAGANGERPRELRDPRDVDALLEDSLGRLVQAVGRLPADDLAERTLEPREGLPLLTPEEIEAFRD